MNLSILLFTLAILGLRLCIFCIYVLLQSGILTNFYQGKAKIMVITFLVSILLSLYIKIPSGILTNLLGINYIYPFIIFFSAGASLFITNNIVVDKKLSLKNIIIAGSIAVITYIIIRLFLSYLGGINFFDSINIYKDIVIQCISCFIGIIYNNHSSKTLQKLLLVLINTNKMINLRRNTLFGIGLSSDANFSPPTQDSTSNPSNIPRNQTTQDSTNNRSTIPRNRINSRVTRLSSRYDEQFRVRKRMGSVIQKYCIAQKKLVNNKYEILEVPYVLPESPIRSTLQLSSSTIFSDVLNIPLGEFNYLEVSNLIQSKMDYPGVKSSKGNYNVIYFGDLFNPNLYGKKDRFVVITHVYNFLYEYDGPNSNINHLKVAKEKSMKYDDNKSYWDSINKTIVWSDYRWGGSIGMRMLNLLRCHTPNNNHILSNVIQDKIRAFKANNS